MDDNTSKTESSPENVYRQKQAADESLEKEVLWANARKKSFWPNQASLSGAKAGIIIMLLLIFLIPLGMIQEIINTRSSRLDSAQSEIVESWGGELNFAGPLLMLSYETEEVGTGAILCAPEVLTINGTSATQIKYRGIYTAPVFLATHKIEGFFNLEPQIRKTEEATGGKKIRWLFDKTRFFFGMRELKGIHGIDAVTVNGQSYPVEPLNLENVLPGYKKVGALTSFSKTENIRFSIDFKYNGGRSIAYLPAGNTTRVKMVSDWATPSFSGKFLPVDKKIKSLPESGFTANWEINRLNRGEIDLRHDSSLVYQEVFGATLLPVVTSYQKVKRTTDYGFLFLLIPFLTLFLFEVILRKKIHLIQYLLVGAANIVFYLLLLSFSEHLLFNTSYLIAVLATGGLITLYAGVAISGWRRCWIVGAVMGLCYGYLFSALQSEEYALLWGSVGLFLMVATVMFVTRKVNWYR